MKNAGCSPKNNTKILNKLNGLRIFKILDHFEKLGMQSSDTVEQFICLKVFKVGYFFSFSILFFYSLFYAFYQEYGGLFLNGLALLILLSVYFLVSEKKIKKARIIFLGVISLVVFLNSVYFGYEYGIFLYLVLIASLPFLFFTKAEIKFPIFISFLSIVFLFFTHYFPKDRVFHSSLPINPSVMFQVNVIILTIGLILISVVNHWINSQISSLQLKEKLVMIQKNRIGALSEFSANIAHELNNPLAIFSGCSERLKSKMKLFNIQDEKCEKQFRLIDESLLRVSITLRSLANLSDGNVEYIGNISVGLIIEDISNLYSEKIKFMDAQILFDKHLSDTYVYGNNILLSQVFIGLFENSFYAIKSNQKKWISIESEIVNKNLIIYFIDSGLGISKENDSSLFTPFFTTKEAKVGLGVSLAIARLIMTSMKGSIDYLPDRKNTTFRLVLPHVKTVSL